MTSPVGLIGFGRASLSRLKALGELGVGHVYLATRRPDVAEKSLSEVTSIPEVSLLKDWRDLLQNDHIEIVFVCSETQLHSKQVSELLIAEKHVCVEFPLCEDQLTARSLFDCAEEVNRILHVECIGTLTSTHNALREHISQGVHFEKIHSKFTGGLYRWVAEAVAQQQVPLLSFGRLFQYVDLFGTLELESSWIFYDGQDEGHSNTAVDERDTLRELNYRLNVTLKAKTAEGETLISIDEERAVGLRRSHQIEVITESGPLDLGSSQKDLLFLRDTVHAFNRAQLRHSGPEVFIPSAYATREKILCTHSLIDEINQTSLYEQKGE